LIELKSVWKSYGKIHALRNVSLTVEPGEFVYLVGPSGAGKTTLLKLLYGEETPTDGEMRIAGFTIGRRRPRHLPFLRRKVGVVFQDFRLLDHLTVEENVAFALEVLEYPPDEVRRRVRDVLHLVGVPHLLQRFPAQLSGGEKQRVAIARAIAPKPEILLADEPTGNLDPDNARRILRILDEINLTGTTVIMATHNRELVERFRRRTLLLMEGRILRDSAAGVIPHEA